MDKAVQHRLSELVMKGHTLDAAVEEVVLRESALFAPANYTATLSDSGQKRGSDEALERELENSKKHCASLQRRLAGQDSGVPPAPESTPNDICALFNARKGCTFPNCKKSHICNVVVGTNDDGSEKLCRQKHSRQQHGV